MDLSWTNKTKCQSPKCWMEGVRLQAKATAYSVTPLVVALFIYYYRFVSSVRSGSAFPSRISTNFRELFDSCGADDKILKRAATVCRFKHTIRTWCTYTVCWCWCCVSIWMLRANIRVIEEERQIEEKEREREASEKVIVQLASVRCCWWLIFRLLLSVAYSAENQKIIPFPPFNPPPNSQRTHEPTTRDTDSSRNRQQQQHVMPLCETVARLGRQRHRRWCVSLHTLPRWEEDSHWPYNIIHPTYGHPRFLLLIEKREREREKNKASSSSSLVIAEIFRAPLSKSIMICLS